MTDKSEVMSGENKRRSRKNIKEQDKVEELSAVQEISEYKTSEHEDTAGKMNSQDHTETLWAGLATIKDIKHLKEEIRHELTTLKDELKKEMKEEISNLQQEIDHKFMENKNDLQTQRVSLTKARTCIAELEEWKTDTGDMMREHARCKKK